LAQAVKIRSGRIWAVLLVFFILSGAAFGLPPLPDRAKIAVPASYEALNAKIGQTGSVRLIVKVDAPFKPMARPDSPDSKVQMKGIEVAQDAILSALAKFNPKAFHKYSYTPYLFVEVDGPALNALLALSRVLEVHEDVPEFPTLDVSVPLIGAPSLWNLYGPGQGFDGTGVAVAVLDTGVDKNHPFLSGAVVSEACYSTTDPANFAQSICPGGVTESIAPGSAMPYTSGLCTPAPPGFPGEGDCDHGTHVAGIIAGRQGVATSPPTVLPGGVAPGASIIAIQVFSNIGGMIGAYPSDIIKGLERVYALRSMYTISSVNMSLGSTATYPDNCDTDTRKPIIDNLKTAGTATVISSGNYGAGAQGSCGSISAPACISSAVSVGATDDSDNVASFSNSATFMSLFAPGVNIMSSVPPTDPPGVPEYPYVNKSGTSMAAPHVAGAWALLKQAKPGESVDQVLTAFASTGPSVTDTTKCPAVTKKRIKLDGADGAFNFLGTGPSAETTAATNLTQTSATLNGIVNANNVSTTVTFEYGTTTFYEIGTVTATQSPVSGIALTQVNQDIAGLTQETLYHYRVVAQNASGTSYGDDMAFTACSPGAAKIVTTYNTIQEAINAADLGGVDAVIKVKAGEFPEDLSLLGAETVTLDGGYDCAFIVKTGFTTIGVPGVTSRSITIGGLGGGPGSVVLEKIVVY
jgi:subtilisin family serine protease